MTANIVAFFRREPSVLVAYAVLLVILAVWVALTPNLSLTSLTNSIGAKLPLVMLAIAATIVIVSRGIDLSVGGTLALTNVIIARGSASDGNVLLWIAVAVAVALVAGLINGLFVSLLRLPPLIVTLAMQSVLVGAALYVLPTPGGSVPSWFSRLSLTLVGPVPLVLVLMIVVPLIVWLPLRRSRFGTALYAVGNDEAAAFVSGVKIRSTVIGAYMLSAFFAALGGIFLTMNTVSGDPNIGTPYTLNSIAAAVLGGALLAGGRGTISGAIAGALILSFITNLLFSLGVSSYWQYVVTGVLLVATLSVPFVAGFFRARKAAHQ
jgi:ribose transport system permease protein